jgi:hypothetical protein
MAEAEIVRLKEALSIAAERIKACQSQLAAAQEEVAHNNMALGAAHQDIAQVRWHQILLDGHVYEPKKQVLCRGSSVVQYHDLLIAAYKRYGEK